MAPLRSSRQNRTQADDDTILKGLPIRQWRESEATIGAPPPDPTPSTHKAPWPELPMPRDSHLLPEVSQQLLRAARAGRIYKPPSPPGDDDPLDPPPEDEKDTEPPRGFTAKRWAAVPRHLEESEQEYLAKRRRGLPTTWGGAPVPVQPPAASRKTRVRKVEPDGSVRVYEVLAPEGQVLDNEVPEEDDEAAIAKVTPGAIIEGVGVANDLGVLIANDLLQPTPNKRKPPPPRKKHKKGPGRGRKKVLFEGVGPEGTPAAPSAPEEKKPVADDVPKEQPTPAEADRERDTPMVDAPEEGEEESGEENEEGEEGEEGEVNDTKPDQAQPQPEVQVKPESPPGSLPQAEALLPPQEQNDTVMADADAPPAPFIAPLPAPPPPSQASPSAPSPRQASPPTPPPPRQASPPAPAPAPPPNRQPSPPAPAPTPIPVVDPPAPIIPPPEPVHDLAPEPTSAPVVEPNAEAFEATEPAAEPAPQPETQPEPEPVAEGVVMEREGPGLETGVVVEGVGGEEGKEEAVPPAPVPERVEETKKPRYPDGEMDLFGSLERGLEEAGR